MMHSLLTFRADIAGDRWSISRLAAGLALLLGAMLFTGCATVANPDPRDPLESYNRSMTNFNEQVDAMVLKPVATAYKEVTPAPVRTGVSNFFGNLGDAWSFVNNLLQLRGLEAYESMVRFSVNSVLGLGGVLDIASEMGIERHRQDFGLTLGHWGVPTGPYLVLPLLGPSTVRDTAGLSVDIFVGDLAGQVNHVPTRNSLYALRFVDKRAQLLRATTVLDAAALDPYSFTRDVYLGLRSASSEGLDDDQGGKLPEDY